MSELVVTVVCSASTSGSGRSGPTRVTARCPRIHWNGPQGPYSCDTSEPNLIIMYPPEYAQGGMSPRVIVAPNGVGEETLFSAVCIVSWR